MFALPRTHSSHQLRYGRRVASCASRSALVGEQGEGQVGAPPRPPLSPPRLPHRLRELQRRHPQRLQRLPPQGAPAAAPPPHPRVAYPPRSDLPDPVRIQSPHSAVPRQCRRGRRKEPSLPGPAETRRATIDLLRPRRTRRVNGLRQPRRGAGARVSHEHPKEVHSAITLKTNALAAGHMDYVPILGSEFNAMPSARELRY